MLQRLNNGNAEFASSTDIGIKYLINQDCLAFDQAVPCFVLADGVGGHQAGEIASQFVVDKLLQEQRSLAAKKLLACNLAASLKLLLFETNQQLIALAASKGIETGTTVVTGLIQNDLLHYMHVGDSRLYLLRNNLLSQLTKDDTLRQQVQDVALLSGATITLQIPANIVTQALGLTAELDIHYGQVYLQQGDQLLCSSDGLHDVVTLETLQQTMVNAVDLQQCANTLLKMALKNHSSDNISVLLMKYSPPLFTTMINRVKKQFR